MKTVMGVAQDGRQQIAHDGATAGSNLNRYGHTWRQIGDSIVNLDLRSIQRNARRIT